MPILLWQSIAIAVTSGILGGIVGPIITNRFIAKYSRAKLEHELQYEAYKFALNTIGLIEADILDIKLQNDLDSYKDTKPDINYRPETRQAIEKTKGLVLTWFPIEIHDAFYEILRTQLSLKNLCYEEHEHIKQKFIILASAEVKVKIKNT